MARFPATTAALRGRFYADDSICRGKNRVSGATRFQYSGRASTATPEVARFAGRIRGFVSIIEPRGDHGRDRIPVLWLSRGNQRLPSTERPDFQLFFRLIVCARARMETFQRPVCSRMQPFVTISTRRKLFVVQNAISKRWKKRGEIVLTDEPTFVIIYHKKCFVIYLFTEFRDSFENSLFEILFTVNKIRCL